MEKIPKKDNKINVKVGPSESMSKSKKIQLIQKKLLMIMELMQLGYLFFR